MGEDPGLHVDAEHLMEVTLDGGPLAQHVPPGDRHPLRRGTRGIVPVAALPFLMPGAAARIPRAVGTRPGVVPELVIRIPDQPFGFSSAGASSSFAAAFSAAFFTAASICFSVTPRAFPTSPVLK